jgi:phosphoglycolate phosphatase-like HAD superfamily hydrolase
MPDEEIAADAELVNMLSSLESEPKPQNVPEEPPSQQVVETAPALIEAPMPQQATEAVPAPTEAIPALAPLDATEDAQEIIKNFRSVRDEILSNYRGDRSQVETAIQLFQQHIRNGVVTQGVTDGYVKALGIKADINSNAIRILDSIARLLAAGKSNGLFVQQIGFGAGDLSKLLKEPLYPDEVRE